METFEEYWASSPGTGGFAEVPADLVKKVANHAYLAGQIQGTKTANDAFMEIINPQP